jgi:DNA-binding NarL/FixJ family response regulator
MRHLLHVHLADRPGVARTALHAMLADTPGVLVTVAGDARAHQSTDARADVVVIDDRLVPELAAQVCDWDATRVIVVGVDDNPGYARRAACVGAEAWVPKERPDLLLHAVLEEPTLHGVTRDTDRVPPGSPRSSRTPAKTPGAVGSENDAKP